MPDRPISFARGAPSLDIVDVEGLRAAADRALSEDPAGALSYGTSVGYVPLRAWIAEQHGVDPEQVLVTNGSMQADAFLFSHLVESGDDVVTENPTYDRTLLSLQGRGARLRMIDVDDEGIDVAQVEAVLSEGLKPKLAHIIPNFQNPGGSTLAGERRRALLGLADQHDFTVFEDDPYVALRFEGSSEPTMLSLEGPDGHVVYASSFSKTVCPGVRVGYLVGPRAIIDAIRTDATNTYISPSMFAQATVNQFCRSGALHESIETVKAALHERASTLGAALERELPDARFTLPAGGYFLWLGLPEGVDGGRLFDAAKERGLAIVKGTDFMLSGGEDAVRLAYSGVTPDEIGEGVGRLAEAMEAVRA